MCLYGLCCLGLGHLPRNGPIPDFLIVHSVVPGRLESALLNEDTKETVQKTSKLLSAAR
jgi:hypothetical protein